MTAPPASTGETIHATCVALGDHAVLLIGASGSGKSDLALRLVDRGWVLVSDDYTVVRAVDGRVVASPPPRIAGRIEVRGIGIVPMPHHADAVVALVCVLDVAVARMPGPATHVVAGVAMPCYALAGLEPSAPVKLEHMMRQMIA